MTKINPKMFVILVFMLAISIPSITALPQFYGISGVVTGECKESAQVNVKAYSTGQMDNIAFLETDFNETTQLSSGDWIYGGVLTDESTLGGTGLDVKITISNTSCSPSAVTVVTSLGVSAAVEINGTLNVPFTLSSPTNQTSTSDNTTTFVWVNDIVSANYSLIVDDSSNFGSAVINQSGILIFNYTLPSELADGTYYWKVEAYQGSKYVMSSGRNVFTLVSGAPSVSAITPAENTYVAAATRSFQLTTTSTGNCAYATSPGVAFGSKTLMTSTGGTTHTATLSLSTEGNNIFYFQCNGTNGIAMSTDVNRTVIRDTLGPTGGSVTINDDDSVSLNSTITINWTGFTDAGIGVISQYLINTVNNSGTAAIVTNPTTLTGLSDGTVRVYIWGKDSLGNVGPDYTDTIVVDTNPPQFSTWTSSPSNLTKYNTGTFRVLVYITDTSSIQAFPRARYRIGSDSFSSYINVVPNVGSQYYFDIPEQASPNDWFSRAGETLYFEVIANDSNGMSNNVTRTEIIDERATAPTFATIADVAALQNSTITITLTGADVDGDSLTYTASDNFTITVINTTTSQAVWIPDNDAVGVNVVTFNQTDGVFSVSQDVTITVININDPPTLAAIGDLSAYEYVQFNYTINGTDVDGDDIIYNSNSSLLIINSETGQILFTPTAADRGEHLINITITDENDATDYEDITLTVNYCGDETCTTTYESCSVCEIDCGICGEDESAGFIIPNKNCLNEYIEIYAARLVPRTTCDVKGQIINQWETCGNKSDTEIVIDKKINGTFTEYTSMITDDYGRASFLAEDEGEFKLKYRSTDFDENNVLFSVKECEFGAKKDIKEESTKNNTQTAETNYPYLEEPVNTDQEKIIANSILILYFVILPIILVLLVTSGAVGYYTYQKTHQGGAFSKYIDNSGINIKKQIKTNYIKVLNLPFVKKSLEKTKPLREEIKNTFDLLGEKINEGSLKIFPEKKIKINYYKLQTDATQIPSMFYLTALRFQDKKTKPERLLTKIETNTSPELPTNLRNLAVELRNIDVKLDYYFSEVGNREELLKVYNKHTKVEKTYPTITDIKTHIQSGKIVIVPMKMNMLNKNAPNRTFFGIVRGFKKNALLVSDYEFTRSENTLISENTFLKAWHSAKTEIIVIHKKK